MKPLEMIKKQRELFVLFDQYQESADQAQRTVLLDKADVLMFSLTGRGHGVGPLIPASKADGTLASFTPYTVDFFNQLHKRFIGDGWTFKLSDTRYGYGRTTATAEKGNKSFFITASLSLFDGEVSASLSDKSIDNSPLAETKFMEKRSNGTKPAEAANMFFDRLISLVNDPIVNDLSNSQLGLFSTVDIDGQQYVIGNVLFNDKHATLYTKRDFESFPMDIDGVMSFDPSKPINDANYLGQDKPLSMSFSELEKLTGRTWGNHSYTSRNGAAKAVETKFTRSIAIANKKYRSDYLVIAPNKWTDSLAENYEIVAIGENVPQAFSDKYGIGNDAATAGTYEDVLSALSLTNSAIAKSIRSNLDHIKGIEEKDPNLAGYSVDYFKGEIQDTLNGHAEDQAVVDLILLAVHAFQVETGITVFTPRQRVWSKRSPKLGLDPRSKTIPPVPRGFNHVPALSADATNKNIVLGFDGINGITQPTTNAGGRVETVYTNKRNNTTIGFDLSKINGTLNPDDVIVNDGGIPAKMVGGIADLEQLEKAKKLVADYVNSVFPLTYKGLTIRADGGDEFYHVSSDTGTYADFPLSKIIADIDSGEAEKKTNLSLDERLALLDEHKIAPATHNEDPMLEQFREGAFNDQSVDDFKATMLKVADLGMPIDEVKSGVYAWAEVDERSRLVA